MRIAHISLIIITNRKHPCVRECVRACMCIHGCTLRSNASCCSAPGATRAPSWSCTCPTPASPTGRCTTATRTSSGTCSACRASSTRSGSRAASTPSSMSSSSWRCSGARSTTSSTSPSPSRSSCAWACSSSSCRPRARPRWAWPSPPSCPWSSSSRCCSRTSPRRRWPYLSSVSRGDRPGDCVTEIMRSQGTSVVKHSPLLNYKFFCQNANVRFYFTTYTVSMKICRWRVVVFS